MRPVAVPLVLCAAWTVAAGKDLNWDLLNYHYYAPYQLLGARLAQDFFAASAQSYLNPVGYLPFYLMVSAGWHSVLVSVLLALAHGSSLALLYAITRRLFQDIKGEALPGVWSQGVKLARSSGITLESSTPSEVVLRVPVPGRAVAPTVEHRH